TLYKGNCLPPGRTPILSVGQIVLLPHPVSTLTPEKPDPGSPTSTIVPSVTPNETSTPTLTPQPSATPPTPPTPSPTPPPTKCPPYPEPGHCRSSGVS
ncbi:MAG TPA: hypothetical protein PKE20_07390, partial [Promineifilum sp.]|nr:hypothetical protein [Promineifilum sp.]